MRRLLESAFYILSIVLCGFVVCFIISLYQYDSCRSVRQSDLNYYTGEIEAFSRVRGTVFLEIPDFPDVDFEIDVWAIDDAEAFEKMMEEGMAGNKSFHIGYTANTMWKDQREVIFLQYEDIVLASADSHEAVVKKNIIIQGVLLAIFGIATIYLTVAFIKHMVRS